MKRYVDVHAHFLPPEFTNLIKKDARFRAELIERDGKRLIQFSGGFTHPYNDLFIYPEARLEYMSQQGIKYHVISVSPRLFYYGATADVAAEVAYVCNNGISEVVKKYDDRFVGMASLPMQDVNLAIKELRRAKDLGFNAIEIGSEVNDRKLSDEHFYPFFEEVVQNDMFVFIHPQAVGKIKYMDEYYLGTILGHPFYTTAAIANLILSGLFDKFPGLKIGLSHAGGYLPYQLGRLEHGFKVRKETRAKIDRSPIDYIKANVYFDTITHSTEALAYLVKVIGVDNIIMGTDYPFDMCEMDPVSRVRSIGLEDEDQDKLLFGNARRLLKLNL